MGDRLLRELRDGVLLLTWNRPERKNAGFREAGRLRRAGYWHGAEADELLMDVVADDQ